MGDPLDVRDDGCPLPVSEMLHSDLEILEHRTGINACEIRSDFVVEAQAIVAAKAFSTAGTRIES